MDSTKIDMATDLWGRVDQSLAASDIDSAMLALRSLCKQGDGHAIALLGLLYEHGTKSRQPNSFIALSKYREAVFRSDDPLAHFGMARAYFNGTGVEADEHGAASHMRKAADLGLPEAALYYGLFLKNGYGVPRDPERAYRYFKIAAEHGYLAAEANIAKWEIRHGSPLGGFVRLVRASARALRISIADPADRRLLHVARR